MKKITLAVQLKNPDIANCMMHLCFFFEVYWSFLFFLSFQQTPVFWEEEEVSDHLFLFNYIISLFSPLVLKQFKLHLSDLTYWYIYILLWISYGSWQNLVSILLQVSVWNVAECKTNTLKHSAAHCALCHTERWSLL